MAKHSELTITEEGFVYQRNEARIAEEAALDGLYVIRTSVPKETLETEEWVARLQSSLRRRAGVSQLQERRSQSPPELPSLGLPRSRACLPLHARPIHVEWHMRKALAPLLFDDDDKPSAQEQRTSIVAPAKPSPKAEQKARTKRTEEGLPVHSFQTLLADLATIAKNRIQPKLPGAEAFDQITRPTPLQRQAFNLLGVKL